MKITKLWSLLVLLALVSCIDPAPVEQPVSSHGNVGEDARVSQSDNSGVAAKNFAQINNTYASLTGISPGDVNGEYQLIKMQLPSTSNPEALNGFNQIASTRLAFAYCDQYIDGRSDLESMSNDNAVQNLIDGFIDIDTNNPEHQVMIGELKGIMADSDNLINDNNNASKKRKLLKLSCTALLASSYVTLI